MKISINFLVQMMQCYSDGQPVYYFSKNCYCYYHSSLFESFQCVEDDFSALNFVPVPSIDRERLMKQFLNNFNITDTMVIDEVRKDRMLTENNCLIDPCSSEFDFGVCFRYFIDGRFLHSADGNRIDLTEKWNDFYYQTTLPEARSWCINNNIRYYTKELPHRRILYKRQYSRETFTKRDVRLLRKKLSETA